MEINYNIVWFGPKLHRKIDYSYWETLMSTHLRAHGIWSFVEQGLPQGADATDERNDQLAL